MAQTIAKERGLRVIDISQKNISPNEFLGYIKYANFVVAVSFHGTVFSILFHKDFYTILAGQKSDVRYKELLKNTNLQDRLIGSVPEYITNVDFRDFDKRRETYSSNSKDYINMLITEEL